jgi:hypothetical protein
VPVSTDPAASDRDAWTEQDAGQQRERQLHPGDHGGEAADLLQVQAAQPMCSSIAQSPGALPTALGAY